jgi:hypothetical protein
MTIAQVRAVEAQEMILIAYGIVAYEDVFKPASHETRFTFRYYFPLGGDPRPRGFRKIGKEEGLPASYNRAT